MVKRSHSRVRIAGALLLVVAAQASNAQSAPPTAASDPVAIAVPSLDFAEQPDMVKGYDRYFYFHRETTSFAEALADLEECDGYARGLAYRIKPNPDDPMVKNTLFGPVFEAIGARLSDRLFGVPERRKARRINMRVCMGYKGYHRYGLPQAIWQSFNFDDAATAPAEQDREKMLMQQAKVASGPHPTRPALN